MKYRMISASALPLALGVAGGGVALKKRGDSVAVELSPRAAERIARYGAVRFETISEPAPAPKPAEPEHAEPIAFAHACFTPFEIATETPPPADADAATE